MPVISQLEDSRRELVDAVAGIPEAEISAKPAPDSWSVFDCVEHVVAVEERFYGFLESAKPLPERREDKEKEAQLTAMVGDRSKRVQAPEVVKPTGRFATLHEALEKFDAGRQRIREFAESHREELCSIGIDHPRFGNMTGKEILVLIAAHSRRHIAQIREARELLGAR